MHGHMNIKLSEPLCSKRLYQLMIL